MFRKHISKYGIKFCCPVIYSDSIFPKADSIFSYSPYYLKIYQARTYMYSDYVFNNFKEQNKMVAIYFFDENVIALNALFSQYLYRVNKTKTTDPWAKSLT